MTTLYIEDSTWAVMSSIATCLGTIVAGIYAYFTYHLLKKSEESVAVSNRIVNFQVYSEISKSLSDDLFYKWALKCQEINLILEPQDKSEVKRFLLNPLEDLALFSQKGLISIDDVSSGYGSTILQVGNNDAIGLLISEEQKVFSETFSGFEELYENIYNKCSSAEVVNYKRRIKDISQHH